MGLKWFENTWLSDLPNYSRLSLSREIYATIPMAIIIGVLSNPICGFIGRKAMGMSDTLVAALMSSNMGGFLLAGLLIGFFSHTRKIICIQLFLLLISLTVLTIGLVPDSVSMGVCATLFLVQIFIANISASLLRTVFPTIWRANYPSSHRGKIVVIISLIVALGSSGTIFFATSMMDQFHLSYKFIFIIGSVASLAAIFFYSKIHIRGEKKTLENLSKENKTPRLFAGLSVLKTDKRFRRFMSWQMLNGVSTMTVEGFVLVILVNDVFESNWLEGGSLLAAVPLLVTGVSGLFWARMFDKQTIFTMRTVSAVIWASARLILVVAIWQKSLAIFMLSRIISGLAFGLGNLNWRLGHMEFAPPDKDALYMGTHVTLTGMRGMAAPFIGKFLYGLSCMGPHGIWLVALSAGGQLLSAWAFWRMHLEKKAQMLKAGDHAEPALPSGTVS